MKKSSMLFLAFGLAYSPHVLAQSDVFNTGRISPLPKDSQRGAFQNSQFEAFEIPDYQLDEAYIQKARQEIATLKRVLSTTTNLNQRSDTQHRLAEAFWEIERTIYLRQMEQYQKRMDLYDQKKIKTKPKAPYFSGKRTFDYYKEIIKTNPRYSRLDEVLFYAGFRGKDAHQDNYQQYLQALVKKYPDSPFVPDAYFQIGQYYFENRQFDKAIANFNQILKSPNKLHNQALYKIAWCYFNKLEFTLAKKVMQKVIESSKDIQSEADLRQEALRDLVLIYSELGEFAEADRYFTSIGEPEYAIIVLEQLSDIYFDQSRYDLAIQTLTLLLKKVPLSSEAPRYHSKLVDCYDRSQRLTTAMREMNTFLATYEPESRWYRENTEEKARKYANTRSEVYARFLAKRYHEESQKYEELDPKKSQNFALTAMGFYKRYFDRFSDHPQAYDLRMLYAELLFQYNRYELAATQFELVVRHNTKGKHAKKALTGQIDALNKVETENYKKVASIAEKQKSRQEKLELPETTKILIGANILYVQLFGTDPKAPPIYFQHAQLYYNYNHFDQSLEGFENVIKKYPNTDSADKSRHLILDIYNIKKDWIALEKTALAFLGVKRFATPENRVVLLDLIQGSIFQQAKNKEAKQDYVGAAQTFESLVRRYPDSKYADKALFNASIDYIRADKANEAIRASSAFLKKYPKSDLAPQLLIAMATYFDDKLDYRNTAKYYELYATKAPKAKAAPDALYNAAVYREQLNQYNQALKNYQTHEKLFPDSKDRITVVFSQGLIYEKQKKHADAAKTFDRFVRLFDRRAVSSVEALYRKGQNLEKINQQSQAKQAYRASVEMYKRVGQSDKATHYASKSAMLLIEPTFKEYMGIKLVMPQRVLERNIQRKFELLRELKKEYIKIVKYNDPEVGVEALYQLGLCYQDFSGALFAAPLPSNLTPEEIQIYQVELQNQALPIEEQAIESFESAIKKSYELNVYTQTSKNAYMQLSQFKPQQYPPVRFQLIKDTYKIEPWSSQYAGGQQ